MKKNIMLAMVIIMMLVTIGGCYRGWDGYGRGGGYERNGGHQRGGEHGRDGNHDRDGGHDSPQRYEERD